jgi:hypothetical protein
MLLLVVQSTQIAAARATCATSIPFTVRIDGFSQRCESTNAPTPANPANPANAADAADATNAISATRRSFHQWQFSVWENGRKTDCPNKLPNLRSNVRDHATECWWCHEARDSRSHKASWRGKLRSVSKTTSWRFVVHKSIIVERS